MQTGMEKIFLNMIKGWEIHNILIESSQYFYFYYARPHVTFFNRFTVQRKNMQKLVTEICKVKNRLSRQITKGAIEKLSRSHTFCEAKHALGQTKFEQQNISLKFRPILVPNCETLF